MENRFGDQDLIFLISQQRAGSTLLQRILGGHPEVHTTAETWLMLHPIYALREQGSDNPHTWEFDLCRVTLGNLKYRKMALVKDYEELLAEDPRNDPFDSCFSLTPPAALPDVSPLPDTLAGFLWMECWQSSLDFPTDTPYNGSV